MGCPPDFILASGYFCWYNENNKANLMEETYVYRNL